MTFGAAATRNGSRESLTINGPFSEQPSGLSTSSPSSRRRALSRPDAIPRQGPSAKETLVDSYRPFLLHETGRLPVYYFPPEDVRRDLLDPAGSRTEADAKGTCERWALRVGDRSVPDAAWS